MNMASMLILGTRTITDEGKRSERKLKKSRRTLTRIPLQYILGMIWTRVQIYLFVH